MPSLTPLEETGDPLPYCTCLSFRTDSPEIYHGKQVTSCPACGRREVLILRCLNRRVHISQHRVPEGHRGEVHHGRG